MIPITLPRHSTLRITACALLLLATCVRAQTVSDISQFVTSMKMDKSFYTIATKTAVRTTLYDTLVNSVGHSAAQALLQRHLASAIEQRQDIWNNNLLSAYRSYFTDDELLSIANQGESSPHTEAFISHRKQVSDEMQVMSADLLLETVATGLHAALTEARSNNDVDEATDP